MNFSLRAGSDLYDTEARKPTENPVFHWLKEPKDRVWGTTATGNEVGKDGSPSKERQTEKTIHTLCLNAAQISG